MPENRCDAVFAQISASRTATAEDVRLLRGLFYGDGFIEPREAKALIALDERIEHFGSDWTQFFHEALTDFLVRQEEPRGYVTAEKAAWLREAIEADGEVKTASELELLVRILEAATSAPADLAAFALGQVAIAVLESSGPLAEAGRLTPGVIGPAEIALLRRILYATGGDGGLSVSRTEAEILFELNDRTDAAANDPEWQSLFVKAIAGSVMAACAYDAPSREDAAEQEAWLADSRADPAGFLKRMAQGGLSGFLTIGRKSADAELWSEHLSSKDAAIAEAEPVDAAEASWLAQRISANGMLDANEEALLRFLKEEAPDIHPALQALFDKVA